MKIIFMGKKREKEVVNKDNKVWLRFDAMHNCVKNCIFLVEFEKVHAITTLTVFS